MGTGLIVPLLTLSAAPVFAVSGTGSGEQTPTTTSADNSGSSTETPKTETPEQVAKRLADMKKRVEENKTALKTKIDEATKKRIIAKCKPAQTVVKGQETSIGSIGVNRGKAFTKISESVQKLVDKLKAAGKDTSEVEANLATAKTKADALTAAITAYKTTLGDLKDMDCATDPTAFAATLATARTQRDAAAAAAKDLRTFLSTTLKASIGKLKSQLESEKSSNSTTSTTPTTTPENTGGNQ